MLEPSDSDGGKVAPGLVLDGRYRLEKHIASGGMARVWMATDTTLNRPVAVKILHSHLYASQDFVARFKREAVAAAQLSHPGIVSVYSTHSSPGIEAIVMELIEGRTLREVLDEVGSLSFVNALQVGTEVARALEVAHRAGIVHRDIKPANIMITSHGRVKVTDFGIAKAATDANLTATGNLLGTAKYMAPEQLEGSSTDPRSDVYSLGVLLYESLAGSAPFKSSTEAATALARLHHDAAPLSQLRPDVSASLEQIISIAMARRPANRFQNAELLAEALDSVDLREAPGVPGHAPSQSAQPHNAGHVAATSRAAPPMIQTGTGGHQPNSGQAAPNPDRATRPRASLITVLVMVLAGLAGLYFGGQWLLDRDSGAANTQATPIIVSAKSFDPQSADAIKSENEQLAPLAFDGDVSTSWRTERYNNAGFAGLKDGVGIIFDLEERSVLQGLELTTPTNGWELDIFIGDQFNGQEQSSWGAPVASISGSAETIGVDLAGAEGEAVLLWVAETGVTNGEHRFVLADVSIR